MYPRLRKQPIEHVLFISPLARVGMFRCPADHPEFQDTGPTDDYLLVFPRTCVRIIPAGKQAIIADPTVVMFYNRMQSYRREPISERGDLCDWFAFSPTLLADALRPFNPRVDQRPDQPFGLHFGSSDHQTYLLQRMIVQALQQTTPIDVLQIEEALLLLLHQTLRESYRSNGTPCSSRHDCTTDHIQLTRALMNLRYPEALSLAMIAQQVHVSPYHLARLFRQQTQLTIHAYRMQLRLRAALEQLAEPHCDLASLAADLGFAHHSHFTAAFHRTFHMPPSTYRRTASLHLMREMRKNLIV